MFNKVYSKIKDLICETKFFFISLFIIIVLFNIKLPYYISAPGGIINLEERVIVENAYKKGGSFNLAYVSQYDGNIPMVLASFIIPNFDLEKREEVLLPEQTIEEYNYLNKLLLESSSNNAVVAAYNLAYDSNDIISIENYVGLVLDKDKTNIEVKDKIVSINGHKIQDISEYRELIKKMDVGDKVPIGISKDNKEVIKYAEVYELEETKTTGLYVVPIIKSKELKKVTFKFKDSESGPSGGLITALSIYNQITKEDIIKGRKIAGTGTIEVDGTVGEISGIKYKIIGAVKNKVDIFFVPKGDNYKEALEIIKEKKYNIKLYPVSNIKEVIKILTKGES